jgi:hypothetical protein
MDRSYRLPPNAAQRGEAASCERGHVRSSKMLAAAPEGGSGRLPGVRVGLALCLRAPARPRRREDEWYVDAGVPHERVTGRHQGSAS